VQQLAALVSWLALITWLWDSFVWNSS